MESTTASTATGTTQNSYIQISRESFWLWEFICIEGLHEEASEFLRDHLKEEIPLALGRYS